MSDTEGGVYGAPFAMLPEWVLDADISDRAVRLFVCLNRYANAKGRAYPGRKVIAARLKCSVDSVDRAMAELVEIQAVQVQPNYRRDGGQTANNYWIWPLVPQPQDRGPQPEKPRTPAAPPRPTDRTPAAPKKESQGNESQGTSPASSDAGTVTSLFETSKEPPPRTAVDEMVEQAFVEFWQAYPRKRDRKPAFAAFRRAVKRGVDAGCMIEGARQYAAEISSAGTRPEHVKYGERWINAEAWENQAEETEDQRIDRLLAAAVARTEGKTA